MSTTTTNTYGFIMPTHNKNAKRPDCYSAKEWEKAVYGAYIGLVNVANNRVEMDQYLAANCGLFNACGMPADEHYFLMLVSAFLNFHKDKASDDPKALEYKVSRKYQVANFFNGDWVRYENATVKNENVKAPKPETTKSPKAKKAKEPTKAELLKQIETLKAALGIAA